MVEICPHDSCTGCNACFNICPKSAISFDKDELGFFYPAIDQDKCIDCKLCQKACPVTQDLKSYPQRVFAAHSSDVDTQKSSTSGGIAATISKYILEQGGVVYGCSGENAAFVHHIRITDVEELPLITGSKYVKSDIGDILKQVKADLQADKYVFFVGTPCQVAGLRGYLRKDYERLFTADFVCHGVPSQQILSDALTAFGVSPVEDYRIRFRRKPKKHTTVYGLVPERRSDGQIAFEKSYPTDLYITGFLRALYYRECCYSCKYATPERVSDFTLGDHHDREGKYTGVLNTGDMLSKVLVNTDKGLALFEKLSERIKFVEISVETCDPPTTNLHRPSRRHRSREQFKADYKQQGFAFAAEKHLRSDIWQARRMNLQIKIAQFIKRFHGLYALLKRFR